MRNYSVFILLPAACLVSYLATGTAWAQGSIPAGGGTSTITRPDSLSDMGYGGFMANSTGNVVAGGVLSGKVVIQGNPMLWEPVTVVLTCTPGKADLTAPTDVNGRYYINHVNVPKVFRTENDSLSNLMMQHYEGCSVSAPLAGYHSTSVTITHKNLRDNPYLANIEVTADEHAPGTAISTVGQSSSAEAMKDFTQAHEQWLHRDTAGAQQTLEKIVQLDPQFAEAWYLLGRLQLSSSLATAAGSFQKAQDADPRFVPPCEYLAGIAVEKRDWQEATRWSNRALALDPAGTAQLWYYTAQADYHMGKNEAARAAAERVLAMDPEHTVPHAEELLALTLIDKGDYADALEHLRNSLNYIEAGPGADLIKRQIAYVEQQSAAVKK